MALPVSFFTALDRGQDADGGDVGPINDRTRDQLLSISRGLAFILLIMYVTHSAHFTVFAMVDCSISRYVASRVFLHRPPPGDDQASLAEREDAPVEMKTAAAHLAEEEPEMNFWMCIISLLVTLALLATTVQFVRSI